MQALTWWLAAILLFGYCALSTWAAPCADEPDSYCFHETCATPLYDTDVGQPCECLPENIGAKFSECKDGARRLIYFWRPPATCLNGTLPPPVDGIPCDLVCPQGTFLNLESPTKSCEDCAPGTISYGGGHRWADWDHWPGQISTYCIVGGQVGNEGCSPWTLNGETINSGDNYNLNYMESILELKVELVRPGSVKFLYKVSAEENYDGLRFLVDNKSFKFVSNTPGDAFAVYSLDLTPGYHTLQWQYYKDYLVTTGDDKATISSIEVEGTTYAYPQCQECPVGHYYPNNGGSECIPCPTNTYADEPQSIECKPCPAGQVSFPAASECKLQISCSDLDESFYTSYYTPCINGMHTRVSEWIYPLACGDITGVALPENVTQSCEPDPCKPGQYLDGNQCKYCPTSEASLGGGATSCIECHAGTAASDKIVYFDTWSQTWPQGIGHSFKSNCTGKDCYTNGWRLAHSFIDSGVGHGLDAQSYVELRVSAFDQSVVHFEYSLSCFQPNNLLVSLNGTIVKNLACSNSCVDNFVTDSIQLNTEAEDSDLFVVRWTYNKQSSELYNCDRVMIKSIDVVGVAEGNAGASSCKDCPPGTFSLDGNSRCTRCPIGQSSAGKADRCNLCGSDSFNDVRGGLCNECGVNTFDTEDRSMCTFNCSSLLFTRDDNTTAIYDLSDLGSWNFTYKDVSINNTITGEYLFRGGVCGWASECKDDNGRPLNSYICYENDSDPINIGKVANIEEIGKGGGVRFTYTHGKRDGKACSTVLDIVCLPPAGSSFLPLSSKAPSLPSDQGIEALRDQCHLELTWQASAGCPTCTASDITYFDQDCVGGKQQRQYVFTSYCYGGEELPQPETLECHNAVKLPVTLIVVLSVVGSVVLIGALGGMAYLWIQNRKLYQDYSKLKESNIPMGSGAEFSISDE